MDKFWYQQKSEMVVTAYTMMAIGYQVNTKKKLIVGFFQVLLIGISIEPQTDNSSVIFDQTPLKY